MLFALPACPHPVDGDVEVLDVWSDNGQCVFHCNIIRNKKNHCPSVCDCD